MYPPDHATPPLRVVIVEDEPLARVLLRDLVLGAPALALVGETDNGRDALSLLQDHQPDVVFLDIHLPELDGLQVLEHAGRQSERPQPHVVFTTAYDAYAVHAFELGAADYLVKPFSRERFARAVERVQRSIRSTPAMPTGVPLVSRVRELYGEASSHVPLRHVYVRTRGGISPVPVSTIERLEADDDYVVLVVGGARHLVTVPLGELLARLDGSRWVRVHRSHAVNLDHVRALLPQDAGRWAVVMQSGERIIASRTGTRQLRESMGRPR